jgi:hypothetical protein
MIAVVLLLSSCAGFEASRNTDLAIDTSVERDRRIIDQVNIGAYEPILTKLDAIGRTEAIVIANRRGLIQSS